MLEDLVRDIEAKGGRAVAVGCDVASQADIDKVVTTAVERFGRIDILANIAQGGITDTAPLDAITAEEAMSAFVTGPLQSLRFMQQCLPHMRQRGYGRIINTASHAALVGEPGRAPYEMAKGAIMALTRVASREWGRYGITVNTFLPVVRTPAFDADEHGRAGAAIVEQQSPVGRFGTPYEDCAPVVAFLASEAAGYINGQAVGVDGGLTLIA
jgi:3-oxoacyl-[acyl-carrier protein] reductase